MDCGTSDVEKNCIRKPYELLGVSRQCDGIIQRMAQSRILPLLPDDKVQ